jgi:hypothetical protein
MTTLLYTKSAADAREHGLCFERVCPRVIETWAVTLMRTRTSAPYFACNFMRASAVATALGACVPPGNSSPSDAGANAANAQAAPTVRPSVNVMRAPFEDTFERAPRALETTAPHASAAPSASTSGSASAPARDAAAHTDGSVARADSAVDAALAVPATPSSEAGASDLGPDWTPSASANATSAWRIEKGRLCVENAKNHGVWLNKTLPVNARIEFEATSYGSEGDIKAEVWGDGRAAATALSYTNATSYLAILGGWKNTLHVLARLNEHGEDRKVITVDPKSDDPRQKAVNVSQTYRFKIERTDGKKVRLSVDGVDFLSFDDTSPLAGFGHDHFGFNNWQVKVCYDNVKITPL